MMNLSVSYDFLPKKQTVLTSQVMDHFGVGFETGKHVIAENFELPAQEGQIVCFTGESGSGKSSLMRSAVRKLSRILDIDQINLEDKPLIDAIDLPVQEGMQILSACGLSEAQLMLRCPAELSDGQRYRFRLALAVSKKPSWIIADEFTATLDRTLAKVVSFNLRKLCDRMKIGFFIATTHEDVLSDLSPDLHVKCSLGDDPQISISPDGNSGTGVKKKSSVSRKSSGSVPRPKPIGRISLGGIIAVTASDSSNM